MLFNHNLFIVSLNERVDCSSRDFLFSEISSLIDEVDVGNGLSMRALSLQRLLLADVDFQKYKHMNVERYGDGSIPSAETTSGMLSVEGSLSCLKEEGRTFPFLKAIRGRVSQLEKMRDGDIEVVDFGCGSLPIMGIMAALSSDRVRVTCVEMNEVSAKMAMDVIEKRGLSDQITVVCGDATKYQHSSAIDLRISETMFAGLMDEPMVDIFEKTHGQMAVDGFTIPCMIVVEASVSRPGYAPYDFSLPLQDVPVFKYVPGCFKGGPYTISGKLSCYEFDVRNRGVEYQLKLGCRVFLDDQGNAICDNASNISRPFPAGPPFILSFEAMHLYFAYGAGTYAKWVNVRAV